MNQDAIAEAGKDISGELYDFFSTGAPNKDEDLGEGAKETSQQLYNFSGIGAIDQSLQVEDGDDVSEERHLLDDRHRQTQATGSARKVRACAVITAAAMMIGAALLPSGTIGLKKASSIKQVVEKTSASELADEDPLALFDCWPGETCELGERESMYMDKKACVEECMDEPTCEGVRIILIPFMTDTCYTISESEQSGCFDRGSSDEYPMIETCQRIHTTVTGEWAPLFIVQSDVENEVAVGTEKTKSSAWERSVSAEVKGGFSGAFTQSESEELTQSKSTTVTHHLDPKLGGQAWQWQFRVGGMSHDILKTKNIVQTKDRAHKPICMPGWNKDTDYQECLDPKYEVQ